MVEVEVRVGGTSSFDNGVYTYYWGDEHQTPCKATCEKHGDVMFCIVNDYWRCTICLSATLCKRQGMLFV